MKFELQKQNRWIQNLKKKKEKKKKGAKAQDFKVMEKIDGGLLWVSIWPCGLSVEEKYKWEVQSNILESGKRNARFGPQ